MSQFDKFIGVSLVVIMLVLIVKVSESMHDTKQVVLSVVTQLQGSK